MAGGLVGRVGRVLERLVFGPTAGLYRRFVRFVLALTVVLSIANGLVVFDVVTVDQAVADWLYLAWIAVFVVFVAAGLVQVVVLARAYGRGAQEVAQTAAELETAAADVAETADEVETAAEAVEEAVDEVAEAADDIETTATEDDAELPEEAAEQAADAKARAATAKEHASDAKDQTEDAKAAASDAEEVAAEAQSTMPADEAEADETEDRHD